MLILGLETSCDETSAAVLNDGKLQSMVVRTQEIHTIYGGVVPEVASRQHILQISDIAATAIQRAEINGTDLDAIAVTYGAGLMGALLVGLNFAKGLSLGWNIPFLGVNHMEGHLSANFIDNPNFDYPFLCLLVSGGHTQIWKVTEFGKYELMGQTRDDAAGEAFDKGARVLGLNYPGGPEIERTAADGDRSKYGFTMPVVRGAELDFSFSGVKTALLYKVQKMTREQISNNLHHICASYQEIIIDTLLDRMNKAIKRSGIKRVAVAGGVAANTRFREKAADIVRKNQIEIHFPALKYCTDNAAMIAMAGYERMKNGETSALDLTAVPNLSLAG